MWSSNSTQNRPSKTCFHKPISGLGMEKKLNLTQQKHAFTNQKKCSTAQFWVTGHWSVQLSVIEKCRTDSILTHTHTHLEHNYCILLLRIIILLLLHNVPSVLWRCWLGGRKGIRPVKNWVVGAGVVICLERGADLHMAQRMPLPLTVSCFIKIQIGVTFLVPAHPGSPGKRAVKQLCVCVCVCVCYFYIMCVCVFIANRWLRKKWVCWMGRYWSIDTNTSVIFLKFLHLQVDKNRFKVMFWGIKCDFAVPLLFLY